MNVTLKLVRLLLFVIKEMKSAFAIKRRQFGFCSSIWVLLPGQHLTLTTLINSALSRPCYKLLSAVESHSITAATYLWLKLINLHSFALWEQIHEGKSSLRIYHCHNQSGGSPPVIKLVDWLYVFAGFCPNSILKSMIPIHILIQLVLEIAVCRCGRHTYTHI